MSEPLCKDHQEKWTHDFVDALKNSDLPWEKINT